MLTLRLGKVSDLYERYGLGASKNLLLMVQLLLLGRTTNLWKLKDYVGMVLGNEQVQPDSHYRRLVRFFDGMSANEAFIIDIQRLILRLLCKLRFTHLLLDGTSWKKGDQSYHYMVLSVLAGQVAIPIYWKQLGKLGASSQEERQAMLQEALKLFDLKGMTLLADREYMGKKWFKYLTDNSIDFVIRLRFADYYEAVDAMPGKTYQQMYDRCVHKRAFVRKQVRLDGQSFFISMRPNPKGTCGEEALIFLTRTCPVTKTIDQYVKRWRIECLFRHLKTNGFGMEDLNLKPPAKSNLMMALLCLAYALSIRTGWKKHADIRMVEYSDQAVFPAHSVFRFGLAMVTTKCQSLCRFVDHLITLLKPINHGILKNV
jgi:hypothetical protein